MSLHLCHLGGLELSDHILKHDVQMQPRFRDMCLVCQAVLIEHDEVVLSDLSAVVVSGGRKGENLIKDYDQVLPLAFQIFGLCCITTLRSASFSTTAASLLMLLCLHPCSLDHV